MLASVSPMVDKILKPALLLKEISLLIFKAICVTVQSIFRTIVPAPKKSINNEIVLITGAGRGIGKELALQYAASGATVICWGISKKKNQATVNEIERLGYSKAYFYECDVTNRELVMETSLKVRLEVGEVTILVNNAGVLCSNPICDQNPTEIEAMLNVNIKSHFWTIQAFLPSMLKNNHGHIVANCSIAALGSVKNCSSYVASKLAVRGMMEVLYHELSLIPDCNVKVTTVYPYLTKTDLINRTQVRFPKFMPVLNASYVAQEIISAQRRNELELVLPKYLGILNTVFRFFPIPVVIMFYEFFNIYIEE